MNLKGWNVMRLIDADNLTRTLSAADNIPWLKGIPVTDVYINKQLGTDVLCWNKNAHKTCISLKNKIYKRRMIPLVKASTAI